MRHCLPYQLLSVADPGLPVGRWGGADLVGRRQLLTRLRLVEFACRNDRIGTLGRRVCPLDPPLSLLSLLLSLRNSSK